MEDSVIVETMLGAAGLQVPPDELAEITVSYKGLRTSADLLYGGDFSETDPFLVPAVAPVVAK